MSRSHLYLFPKGDATKTLGNRELHSQRRYGKESEVSKAKLGTAFMRNRVYAKETRKVLLLKQASLQSAAVMLLGEGGALIPFRRHPCLLCVQLYRPRSPRSALLGPCGGSLSRPRIHEHSCRYTKSYSAVFRAILRLWYSDLEVKTK